MTQTETDAAFLREYQEFCSQGPLIVAECLHAALLKAHRDRKFARVAHLQVRLHAEMVLSLEITGAFLRAYSEWDKSGGILRSLLSYRPRDVAKFIKRLQASDDALSFLCFPTKNDVLSYLGDTDLVEKYYTGEQLKHEVQDTCQMYLSEVVRGAYNKLKHAGLYVRHAKSVDGGPRKIVCFKDVYLMLSWKATKPLFVSFPVTGKAGPRLAEKYLSNVRVITQRSSTWAGFVAYCLEHNLLRPSS